MPKLNFVLLALILSGSTVGSIGAPLKDDALARALEGAWCASEDGGKTCWGYDDFGEGMVNSCGRFPETTAIFTARATYDVRNSRVCHVVTAASKSFPMAVGDRFCVEVLDIDARTQRFRLESGDVATIFRVPREKVRCPSEQAMTPNSVLFTNTYT